MIYTVLLCDKDWIIDRIQRNVSELSFQQGDCLTDMVQDADELIENDEEQYSLFLTFRENGMTLSTLVRSFQEGNLVILSHVRSDADFIEFNNEYPDLVEWAENHLDGFYHSEYFQIQKLNNQLIDSQRALIRSKMNLEMALEENKKINQKISEARQAAEKASRSKTQFLANMSHDIRTPMNAIVGLTKLMQHNLNNPEILSSYIQKLQSSSEYLLGLINDILDLSKIENGSIELKKEPMNLRKVTEQIAAIIRPNALAGGKKFRVFADDFYHEDVLGDPIRLRQVLMNLLSNAVKYTPEGGEICLRAEELSSAEKHAKYRFTVEDTGMGMTEKFQQHIFEPFSREKTMENEIQGTGLGMAITKSIVDSMRGNIEVHSILGKGSRFEVELSFVLDENAAEDQQQNAGQDWIPAEDIEEAGIEETEGSIFNGMHFLCAEDNDLNAEILKSMLELKGASCIVCPNGKAVVEAFEEAAADEYDAILMDVQMPVMNGYEACERIRTSKKDFGKTIPIIAMTANAFSEDIKRSLNAGMDAHVSKPIDLELLEKELWRLKKK